MKGTVLISGANRGIGLEAVRQYSASGWRVLATCRNPDRAVELAALAKANTSTEILALDMTKPEVINRTGEELASQAIDVLFLNAGCGEFSRTLAGVDVQQWQHLFLVNAIAPVLTAQALLPSLRLGSQKTIALMTSKMGSLSDNTSGGVYAYRTSKAALNMAGKSLALDLRSEAIKVLLMHPGWVRTDMGGPNALIDAEESVEGLRRLIDNLSLQDSGCFKAYDGSVIEW